MKKLFTPVYNEKGSMILVAILLLVILTLMGITSTQTSIIENRIAVNEQLHKMSFYNADSGIYTSAKIISLTVDEGDVVPDDDFGFEYSERYDIDDFYDHITGLATYDDGLYDVRYVMENDLCQDDECIVRADIQYLGTSASGEPSGGVVFGEGATSPIGGQEISVFFRISSEGTSLRNSATIVNAIYRKVLGVQGGL